MSKQLQESFDLALQSASGSDAFSRLVSSSLRTSAHQFPGLGLKLPERPPGLSFRLADAQAPGSLIAAHEAGDMLQRIQRAVARLARARRLRLPDVAKIHPIDLEVARLNVALSLPGSLIVDLTPQTGLAEEREEGLPTPDTSWAEIGAAELFRALPETEDDDLSLDSLLDASPVVRRAVADLIMKRPNPNLDLSFTLDRYSGEGIQASLTARQAQELEERLNMTREEREVVRMTGRLDGVRTRRQLFYFEPDGRPEIHGFVDDSLVGAVKAHLDSQVTVALETFVLRSSSGRRGQRRYRLIEVEGQVSQLPPTSELDDEIF